MMTVFLTVCTFWVGVVLGVQLYEWWERRNAR